MSFINTFAKTFEKLSSMGQGVAQPSPTGETRLPGISVTPKQGPSGGMMTYQYEVPSQYQNKPITGPTQVDGSSFGNGMSGKKPRTLQDTLKSHNLLVKSKVDLDKLKRKSTQDEEFDNARHQQRMQTFQPQQPMYGQIQ